MEKEKDKKKTSARSRTLKKKGILSADKFYFFLVSVRHSFPNDERKSACDTRNKLNEKYQRESLSFSQCSGAASARAWVFIVVFISLDHFLFPIINSSFGSKKKVLALRAPEK